MIDRRKRSKALNEVKPVENISRSPQIFLEICPMEKEALPSNKLQDLGYEEQNPFRLNKDNPSKRNCQNQSSHPSFSHIEQECQESLIQGKICIQQKLSEDLEYW